MSGTQAQAEEADDEIEIEIVDDTPEEDRGRPKAPDQTESDDDITVPDDEVSKYRADFQKRIKDLSFKAHSERRAKEAALREKAEAERLAKLALDEARRLREQTNTAERLMVDQASKRAETQIDALKRQVREALEAGDTAKFVDLQEALQRAVAEHEEYRRYRPAPVEREPEAAPAPPAPPAPPRPNAKQRAFLERNPWFDAPGELEYEMTGHAYAIHHRLVAERGMDPNSDEYYAEIEKAGRRRFPEYWKEEPDTPQVAKDATPRASVVAPAVRNTGRAPRTVHLTATQLSLCKKLGLTPQQYAAQLLKEQGNG